MVKAMTNEQLALYLESLRDKLKIAISRDISDLSKERFYKKRTPLSFIFRESPFQEVEKFEKELSAHIDRLKPFP